MSAFLQKVIKGNDDAAAILISSECGALGVITGLAIFLQLPAELSGKEVSLLLIAVSATALLSAFFEYIRGKIDGEEKSPTFARRIWAFIAWLVAVACAICALKVRTPLACGFAGTFLLMVVLFEIAVAGQIGRSSLKTIGPWSHSESGW
jgi:hypothetical protein